MCHRRGDDLETFDSTDRCEFSRRVLDTVVAVGNVTVVVGERVDNVVQDLLLVNGLMTSAGDLRCWVSPQCTLTRRRITLRSIQRADDD